MYKRDGSITLSSEHAEESVQKNRRQLQEQIQIKSDSLSIIFQMIYTLEYVSNSARVRILQKIALIKFIFDEIDRMQHEWD
jgi:hypothetical protein